MASLSVWLSDQRIVSGLGRVRTYYSMAPSLPLWCWRVVLLPVFSAAALHGLMQLSPTASRRTYVARRAIFVSLEASSA